MKRMRKLLAVLLTFVMVMGLGVTALADEVTYTLIIKNTKTGHTYEVYQIFTGDISGVEDYYVLANVKYGENYGTKGELVPEDVLKAIEDADTFAQTVVVTGEAFKTVPSADGKTEITGLPAGYYLVKETSGTIPEHDAYTKHILQVVGDTTIKVKSAVPIVIKKVKEDDKNVGGNTDPNLSGYDVGDGYNDVADYDIGEPVPFKLIGTLPDRYDDYKAYTYIFHDTLSEGLDFVEGSVKVYVDNSNGEIESDELKDITSSFAVTKDGGNLKISCEDLKAIENSTIVSTSKIVVTYDALLTEKAVIGLYGNENEVYLEFSNNPNLNGDGTPNDSTGNTEKDKVIVFTYELDVTKIDAELKEENEVPLEGAEFILLNEEQDKVAEVEDGKLVRWAAYTEGAGSTLVSDKDGKFIIAGLDDGTYYLKETKAPTGYNLLADPIKVVISATTTNIQSWDGVATNALTALTIKVDDGEAVNGVLNTGIVETKVKNNAGTVLPETGGIGTTIFYIVGSILVIGAAVILITRRRMDAK